MFSIVLPTFNREKHIGAAIQSVCQQSISDWELLVVDDGSTDGTKDIVEGFQDSRIIYLYQDNAERSAARNHGIAKAKGEWICFLDSDDVYLPEHLAVFSQAIEQSSKPRILLSGCLRRNIGVDTPHPLIDVNKNLIEEVWNQFILLNALCCHSSLLEHHQFDERFRIWEDTHFCTRLFSQHEIEVIPKYTCVQIVNETGTVSIGLAHVMWKDVSQYLSAIEHAYQSTGIKEKITKDFYRSYVRQKLRMYLYQSRSNGQWIVALRIWIKCLIFYPSSFLILEFPKIFINGMLNRKTKI